MGDCTLISLSYPDITIVLIFLLISWTEAKFDIINNIKGLLF